MSTLIDREALLDAIRNSLPPMPADDLIEDVINAVPEVVPQVVINVTGGVAEGVAADYRVDLNVLDYDIVDDEQDDYVVDETGDQAWLYGERIPADPAQVKKILGWPTVA